jgi:hypothetical protein
MTFVKTAMRSCYFSDFKEMVACALSAALSAIQDNSDLPQGLKPTIGGTVAGEGSRASMPSFELKEADQLAGNPSLVG